jgi:hypothetical protein
VSEAKNQVGFYYIEVRPTAEYKTFRAQEIRGKDGIERGGGQRADGAWETVKWLVGKQLAHVEKDGTLVADHPDAKELFDQLSSPPKRIRGDRFEARDGKQK